MNRAVLLLVLCAAGAYASEYNCDAQSKVCQNGGLCHDNVNNNVNGPIPAGSGSHVTGTGWMDPTCICAAPYAGPYCQYTVRECKDSPCKNGATCVPADCQANPSSLAYQNGQWAYDCFKCECAPGWTASPIYSGNSVNPNGLCDMPQPINDCTNNQCLNGGTCTNTAYSNGVGYSCACASPWGRGGNNGGGSHLNCTYNCNSATPCLNGGSCNTASGICSCVNGYYGNQCEFTAACMTAGYCQNGGTCHTNTGVFTGVCACATGYSGARCQTHACDSNPCQNGGTCTNTNSGFTCTCPTITGVNPGNLSPTCGYFCQSLPCQNGATCTNNAGGAGTCTCAPGWVGPTCSRALNFGCGQPYQSCVSQNAATSAPATLNNACKCRDQGTCSTYNYDGRCTCRGSEGYNPFQVANTLIPSFLATSETFVYDCRCNSTFTPRCPAIASQAFNGFLTQAGYVNPVCQNGGFCIEWAEGAGCACRPGFWGTTCQNYDNPCLNNPCKNQGACQIVQESGTAWLGEVYSLYPTAHVTPALDDRFWGYMCQCKWPYYGEHCENVAPTNGVFCPTPDPCQNGGTCGGNQAGGAYWTGLNTGAQTWLPSQPVLYVSNLMAPVGNYLAAQLPYGCACTANFTGPLCQTPVQTCANSPNYCMNGGTCADQSTPGLGVRTGSFDGSVPFCMCPCGYAGDRCEVVATNAVASALALLADVNGGVGYRLNFCGNNPCQNGATCVNSLSGQTFYCQCKSGWGDRYCQTRVRSAAAGVAPSIVVAAAAILAAFALRN